MCEQYTSALIGGLRTPLCDGEGEMDDYAIKLLAPALRVQWERMAVIVGFRLWLNRHATMLPRANAVATLYT